MDEVKFLDIEGLTYLWSKIKSQDSLKGGYITYNESTKTLDLLEKSGGAVLSSVDITKLPNGKSLTAFTSNTSNGIAEAKADNVGQVLYLTQECTLESGTYQPGAYIVTGEGTVSKLGTTSATGDDLSSEVESLKGQVNTISSDLTNLKTYIGQSEDSGISDLTTYTRDLNDKYTAVQNTLTNLAVVKSSTAEEGYAATYKLMSGGTQYGEAINIPKDMVAESGEIVQYTGVESGFPPEAQVGDKYLKLEIANSGPIYIALDDIGGSVKDLIEGDGISIVDDTISVDTDWIDQYLKSSSESSDQNKLKSVLDTYLETSIQQGNTLNNVLNNYLTNEETGVLISYALKTDLDNKLDKTAKITTLEIDSICK